MTMVQYDVFGDHLALIPAIPLRQTMQRMFQAMKDSSWCTIDELCKRLEVDRESVKVALAMLSKDPLVLTIEVMNRGNSKARFKLIPNKKRLPQ